MISRTGTRGRHFLACAILVNGIAGFVHAQTTLYSGGVSVRDASFASFSFKSNTTSAQYQMASDFQIAGCGPRTVTSAQWLGGVIDQSGGNLPDADGVQYTFDLLFFNNRFLAGCCFAPTGGPLNTIPGTAFAHRQVTATGSAHPAADPNIGLYSASFPGVSLEGNTQYWLVILARGNFSHTEVVLGTGWGWSGQASGEGSAVQGGTNFSSSWLSTGRQQFLTLSGTVDGTDPPPGNDNCSGAEALVHSGGQSDNDISVPIDTRCATDSILTTSNACIDGVEGSSPIGADIYFEYVAPCTATLRASMCVNDGGGGTYDAIMDIHSDGTGNSACPADLSTLLQCDDEFCTTDEQGNSILDAGRPIIDQQVQFGVLYHIRVGGWDGAQGTGTLTISIDCPPDCNVNGIEDACDIDCGPGGGPCDVAGCGLSTDCNANNLPDECDPDADVDGIPDDCDNCPDGANESQEDADADGVGDVCDGCASDPDKTTPGGCGCGTPDDDNDQDGTLACNEECDNDPDKVVVGACGCGTPDDDTDGDGVADCVDNCPDLSNVGQEDCDGDGQGDACILADQLDVDCNANGIPDQCDLADGTSNDCNRNGLPDECDIDVNSPAAGGPFHCLADCDPDCNDNGLPDFCDIESGTSNDCSEDGVPDECEPDCNSNGIADSCDIRDCGTPESLLDPEDCDDCFVNGIPDECDIASGADVDLNDDGIPDSCFEVVESTSASAIVAQSPQPPAQTHYTFDGSGSGNVAGTTVVVELDIPITMASLRILNGAILAVTGSVDEDLTIATDGGLLLRGDPADSSRVSQILVANDRVINVANGPVRLEGGAFYGADPQAGGPVSASLIAESLSVIGGGDQGLDAGRVELTDSMSVTTGDLLLDGRGASSCGKAIAGGRTSPILRFRDSSRMTILGDFVIRESALVEMGVVDGGGDPSIELGGDFINESVDPCLFNWPEGSLTFTGSGPQTFETAGLDVGLSAVGFDTGTDTNFSMNEIRLPAGSDVTFVDRFTNISQSASGTVAGTDTTDACLAALYTNMLFLGADATATLSNTTVYYAVITDDEGNVSVVGCGSLTELPGCMVDDDCNDGLFCTGFSPCLLLPQSSDGICDPLSAPCLAEEICDEDIDQCRPDCTPVDAALSEPGGISKNRYLSFEATNGGEITALRVTLDQVSGFEGMNGSVRWAGAPEEFDDGVSGTFWASVLQCEPHFMAWGDVGMIHVYGADVVPESTYQVQSIHESCADALDDEAGYAESLIITTAKWGDVVAPFFVEGGPGQPDFTDIASLVDKFTGGLNAPSKSRAQLQPNVVRPGSEVDFSDISAVVDAFTGSGYPFTGPDVCP